MNSLFDTQPDATAAPHDNNKTLRMIGAIAQMSGNRHLAAMLAELGQVDLGPADEQHWLLGPLVVHNSPWNADVPAWCHEQALAERWKIVAGDLPGHIVGPTEIVCVCFGAIMEAPRHNELTEMYLWASRHAIVSHFGAESDSAKAAIENQGTRYTDKDVLKPAGYLYQDYRQLASEIRRKVAAAHREESKQTNREVRETKAAARANVPVPVVVNRPPQAQQFDIFALPALQKG